MRDGTNIATTRRRASNRMTGKAQTGDFLRRVNAENIGLAIDDSRAASRVTAVLGNDKRVIENVIIQTQASKITRQTDVEAWYQ